MTVVYLDSFLLINFTLNYLLLLASGKLAGEPLYKWRFALAAALGAAYAALTFFPQLRVFLHPVYKLTAALLMLLISFGGTRRLLRIAAIFLAMSCAFCGGILAIEFLKGGSYMADGVVYFSVDAKGLLISAIFCYGVLCLFFRRSAKHDPGHGEIVEIKLRRGEEAITLQALRDTGNPLQDPVTGKQIPVVEGERVTKKLLPASWNLGHEQLVNPIKTLEQLIASSSDAKVRLLPYRAVGVDCGMLLAVRLDEVIIEKRAYRDHLVALSPNPVSDGGAYCALVGCQQG